MCKWETKESEAEVCVCPIEKLVTESLAALSAIELVSLRRNVAADEERWRRVEKSVKAWRLSW